MKDKNMRTKEYPTQDKINELLSYKDGRLFWKKNFKGGVKIGDMGGYELPSKYRTIHIDGCQYYEHRLVWIMHYGNIPADLEIDHINLIRNDNRVENLRIVSRSTNLQNTTSKNIYFRPNKSKKYEAYFNIAGKRKTKSFSTEEEAKRWILENKSKNNA
jgi:hypothetical protein